jgi:hypothetical protein
VERIKEEKELKKRKNKNIKDRVRESRRKSTRVKRKGYENVIVRKRYL